MEWRPLKNYEKYYEISEFGDVRSLKRFHETRNRFGPMLRSCGGKPMKVHSDKRYLFIELNTDKKVKKVLIHRLVYSTFIGNLIDGKIIHHKDKNKNNNHYSNLEQIDFISHNNIHSHPAWNKGIKNPKEMVKNACESREKNFIKKCRSVFELRQEGKSNKEISDILGICTRQVIHRNKRYKEFYNL